MNWFYIQSFKTEKEAIKFINKRKRLNNQEYKIKECHGEYRVYEGR